MHIFGILRVHRVLLCIWFPHHMGCLTLQRVSSAPCGHAWHSQHEYWRKHGRKITSYSLGDGGNSLEIRNDFKHKNPSYQMMMWNHRLCTSRPVSKSHSYDFWYWNRNVIGETWCEIRTFRFHIKSYPGSRKALNYKQVCMKLVWDWNSD